MWVGVRVITPANGAEGALDHLFHAFGIKIPHNDNRLSLWTIPAVIETDELGARRVAHNRHVADGDAAGIAAAGEQYGQGVLIEAHHLVGMHAPLLLDDASFLLDGPVVEVELRHQVPHHQQDGVEQFSALGGDVRDLEPRVVKARRCVDVAAIGHAGLLQHLHHHDAGEIARSLPRDVLDEVGQATFVILLDKRARVLNQPELGASLRLAVVTDVVGQSVIKAPGPQVGVHRQLLFGPCNGGQHRHHRDDQYDCSSAQVLVFSF